MKRFSRLLVALALLLPIQASSQQEETYDYWRFNRNMIQYGQQAILMCNGLFTSGRTLEQVFDQELAYLRQPVGTPRGGDYVVDRERKAVAIGAPGGTHGHACRVPRGTRLRDHGAGPDIRRHRAPGHIRGFSPGHIRGFMCMTGCGSRLRIARLPSGWPGTAPETPWR